MYLDKFKSRFEEVEHLYLKDKFSLRTDTTHLTACTEEEVLALENQLQLSLPDAYKEFLLWGGRWARGFMVGSSFFFNDDFIDIQEVAVELLEDNQFPESLPADAFVFLIHQGYYFMFFRTSEGNNPPIYGYEDGQSILTFKNEYSSYTDFLADQLEIEIKCRTSNPLPEGVEEEIYRDKSIEEMLKDYEEYFKES